MAGLYNLIVAFVIAGIIWYASTIIPSLVIQKLAQVVAIVVAVIGLLNFLRGYLGA